MKFTRNCRFERDLLRFRRCRSMPANTTRVTCEEKISLRFARLWETGSLVRHRRVQCTLRASRSVVPSIQTTAHVSRHPFRYKFRWNSSLSQSARYQWWGTHLDWVFPLLFILFLRIVSHYVSLKEPISLPQPGRRPTMTTRTRKTTTLTATTTTTKFHLIKFALYWSAHCGERFLSKSSEIWRQLWAGALIRSDLLEQMNERPFVRLRTFLPNKIEKSIDSITSSFWLETWTRRSSSSISALGLKLIPITLSHNNYKFKRVLNVLCERNYFETSHKIKSEEMFVARDEMFSILFNIICIILYYSYVKILLLSFIWN